MQLEGKTVLVTGGNDGIGRDIARQLAAKGAYVVIVARDAGRAAAAMAGCEDRMAFLQADLRLDAEQDRVVTEVAGQWPGLAVLVNNAGIQVNLPAMGIGDGGLTDALRREVEINLIAPVVLSLGLMPLLARQPEAAIVNIASGLAIAPKRTAPVYCATKAGLRSFSQALRYRCVDAAPAIRVIDVIMSYVDTAMTQDRGGTKIASADAARAVIDGIEADRDEVWVGRTRLLRLIHRLSPTLAARILRNA